MKAFFLLCFIFFLTIFSNAQPAWQASLNGKVAFYQTTDFGIVLAGTEIRFTRSTGRPARCSGGAIIAV